MDKTISDIVNNFLDYRILGVDIGRWCIYGIFYGITYGAVKAITNRIPTRPNNYNQKLPEPPFETAAVETEQKH